MAWKKKYLCKACGYAAEIYQGKGFMGQHISAVSCSDCHTLQNLVVGGVIGHVAKSFDTEVGRLCPNCGSQAIRRWDGHTCPRCGGTMEATGEEEFWC